MQYLLSHLVQRHVTASPPAILVSLMSRPFDALVLTSSNLSAEQLNFVQYLIAKNIVSYSNATLSLQLNINYLLAFMRIWKLVNFCNDKMQSDFAAIVKQFLTNQMLPVTASHSLLLKVRGEPQQEAPQQTHKPVKGKNKSHPPKKNKQETSAVQSSSFQLDLSRVFYEYSPSADGEGKDGELAVNLDELTQYLKYYKLQQHLGPERSQDLIDKLKDLGKGDLSTLTHITNHTQLFTLLYQVRQEKTGPRIELLKTYLAKVRHQKLEEYLLQLFRKHDPISEQQEYLPTESVSANVLLTFNLLKAHPLLSQKQLAGLSLLPLVIQRKCLNLLVQEGLVHFYPENARTLAYKVRDQAELQQVVLNSVGKSIYNLQQAMEVLDRLNHKKDTLLKMELMVQQLDDVLLLLL